MDLPDKEERRRILSAAADRVQRWVLNSPRGTSEIYHEGFLLDDRETDLEADGVAKALMRFSDQGLIHLTQKRLGDAHYEYRATRSSVVPPKLRRVG
jgi:hypothetical protein